MAIGSPQWMYASGEDFTLDQSLRFSHYTDNDYLSWTPSSAGNRRTWTYSVWVKNCISSENNALLRHWTSDNNFQHLVLNSNGTIAFQQRTTGGGNIFYEYTTPVYRDPSAWYHILLAVDTTQATDTNRVKFYVNGAQVTDLSYSGSIDNYPAQNYEGFINDALEHRIGIWQETGGGGSRGGHMYMAEVHFIDGQALTPASFGETGTYGEWKPKEVTGVTYGNNGFYLPFKQDYTVEGFSTVTWKGNGNYGHYIGGTGFKPDLIWTKRRDGSVSHQLVDVIRGAGNRLNSNNTNSEGTYIGVNSFNSDGFSLGTDDAYNGSGSSYVSWNWDMGANSPTGFGCVIWTGNAVDNREISGVGFQPDLVWLKSRSDADHTYVQDSVRGAQKQLITTETGAETSYTNGVKSFTPDGFTLGTSNWAGEDNQTRVAWCWDMGGTTATNTDGSITSTVMANPTYGQSIVSWEGTEANATIGHGLSSAPEMIIVKNRDRVCNWEVYYGDNTDYLRLNTTDATVDNVNRWNDTSPTSSVISLGAGANVNGNNESVIAYCFHSVSGYSKFGTYTGDATTNHSNSVTLGFRPAFLMVKKTSGTGNWVIVDNVRNPMSNDVDKYVKADTTDAEATQSGELFKFTSTGFTIGANLGDVNASGATYVYMAFAGGMDSISDYNDTGSIDSRVKANPTYGQSIVKYVGDQTSAQTVGHGLSSAPEMIIVKELELAKSWAVYHTGLGNTHSLKLNDDSATYDNVNRWNDTTPTSTVFSIGTSDETNYTDDNHIAYCFHSVTGYSKFDTYTGTAGTHTITTGFNPAFIMIKRTNTTGEHWYMYDNTRFPHSQQNNVTANNDSAESGNSSMLINYLATGFQLVGTNAGINASGDTYIYAAFADKREYAYWLDQSGNNNDWASNNLTESDIMVDSPTNNFATMNPLINMSGEQPSSYAEGNLKVVTPASGNGYTSGTMGMSSGKWYWEFLMTAHTGSAAAKIGITKGILNNSGAEAGDVADEYIYTALTGWKQNVSGSAYGATWTTGDIIGVTYDADDGDLVFYKNNVSQGDAYTGLTGTFFPVMSDASGAAHGVTINWNFGADSSFAGNKTAQGNQDGNSIGDFYYEPPSGFLALCTSNLPAATVTPSEHFNTVLYTGTTGGQSITGVGFQPDLLVIKNYQNAGYSHQWFDVLRGVTKDINSNSTEQEQTISDSMTSFDSDGFTLGADSSNAEVNNNTKGYIAHSWKGGGSGSANTVGDIDSTVSVNTDAGFSIVSYTGDGNSPATIGHGLSKAPELIHIKNRTDVDSWISFTTVIDGSLDYMYLNLTNAKANLGISTPTSTVFSVDDGNQINGSGDAHIAYCFHSVDGYSKVGSYTGNGNADGTFVYTGFRPAYVLIKPSSRTGHWHIVNNESSPSNVVDKVIFANDSAAEYTDPSADCKKDFLSNGFKIRTTDDNTNESGSTYIYIAFAETPFKYANAR